MTNTQTTTMSDVTTPDDQTINSDFTCINCDYNLRTIKRSGNCPECGTAVGDSFRRDLHIAGDPRWLRRIHFGVWTLAVGYGISLFFSLVYLYLTVEFEFPLFSGTESRVLWIFHIFLSSVYLFGSSFLLTARMPGDESPQMRRLRWAIRSGCLLAVAADCLRIALIGIWIDLDDSFTDSPFMSFLDIGSAVATLGSAIATVGCLVLLNRLAKQISERRLIRQLPRIVIAEAISYGVIFISYTLSLQVDWQWLTFDVGHVIRSSGSCIATAVGLYALPAVLSMGAIIGQVRKQVAGQAQPFDQYEPGSYVRQPLAWIDRKYLARTCGGLNLLKWSLILLIFGIVGMIETAMMWNAQWVAIVCSMALCLAVVSFGIGCSRTVRLLKNVSGEMITVDVIPSVVLALMGMAVATFIAAAFGAAFAGSGIIHISEKVFQGAAIYAFACGMLSLFGVMNHLRWLAKLADHKALTRQFRRLVILSFLTACVFLACLLYDIYVHDWDDNAIAALGIYLALAGIGLAVWAMILVDQLWREFDRAKLVIGG